MSLTIVDTWTPSSEEWDNMWQNCPYSTYFHSREWAEIWAVYTGGKINPDPLGITISDGTKVILPFSRERIFKGLAKRYISSPAGTFGGWLSDRPLNVFQQTLLIKFVVNHYENLVWRFNPYEKILCKPGFGCITLDETHVLNLSLGFEEIYRSWTKGHSSAARKARKARKAGVEISLAESMEDWENYFRVYEDSLIRWGEKKTSTYSWHLFKEFFQRSSPNIKLWLAKYDGLIIAGALCFYSSSHAVYWHGAVLSTYFELRPVNLLMYEVIRDAADHGFKWFDFNPSGDLEGVRAFKRSFGAIALSCNVVTNKSLKTRILLRIAQLSLYRIK